jgi:hypothetical protein
VDGPELDLSPLLPDPTGRDAKNSPRCGRLKKLQIKAELIRTKDLTRTNSVGTEVGLENAMLAEKFLLMIETLIRSQAYMDGSRRVVSTSPHVPVTLPAASRAEPPAADRQVDPQASRALDPYMRCRIVERAAGQRVVLSRRYFAVRNCVSAHGAPCLLPRAMPA